MTGSVLDTAFDLIRRQSVTPEDAGCQTMMMDRLKRLGFTCETMRFNDTDNFWATRGDAAPCFVFAGHTDVVPVGKLKKWNTDPFEPTVIDGILYGRGAADMKGSLAAMLVATERFIEQHPDHRGQLAFLITSDEEGPSTHGTVKVVETLMARNQPIDYALVGEPSSTEFLGDVIKNGRRGSLTGHLTIHGIQGHVAYPHLAKNSVHESLAALAELSGKEWDQGNEHFPPTSFQITNVAAGTGASNVVPGEFDVQFNFRYCTEQTHQGLVKQVEDMLRDHSLDFEIEWNVNGEPFLTEKGALLDACVETIQQHCGYAPSAETTGGTSDGRFIAKTGAQVVELGPINATIHKVNESVPVEQIEKLADLYFDILKQLLVD